MKLYLLLVLFIFMTACGTTGSDSSSGSLTGILVVGNGSPVAAKVSLVSADAINETIMETDADESGVFTFADVADGSYHVVAVDGWEQGGVAHDVEVVGTAETVEITLSDFKTHRHDFAQENAEIYFYNIPIESYSDDTTLYYLENDSNFYVLKDDEESTYRYSPEEGVVNLALPSEELSSATSTTVYVLDSIRGITFKRPQSGFVDSLELNDYTIKSDSTNDWNTSVSFTIRRIEDTLSLRSKIHDIYVDSYEYVYEKISGDNSRDLLLHTYTKRYVIDTVNDVIIYGLYDYHVFAEYTFENTVIDMNLTNYTMAKPELLAYHDTLLNTINFDGYADTQFVPVTAQKGTMVDERDGQEYDVATINAQVWMAENLNYDISGSYCYDDNELNCDNFGRLYTWLIATENQQISDEVPSGIQGVCPAGWHLPSRGEWVLLESYLRGMAGDDTGPVLMSISGWGDKNGYDDLGFSALPAGMRHLEGVYEGNGNSTNWMSISYGEHGYSTWEVSLGLLYLRESEWTRSYAVSIRCVQDK